MWSLTQADHVLTHLGAGATALARLPQLTVSPLPHFPARVFACPLELGATLSFRPFTLGFAGLLYQGCRTLLPVLIAAC